MISLKDWDSLYRSTFDWVLRRLDPYCLEMYRDTEQDWIEALKAFNLVQAELFENYSVNYKSGTKYKKTCIKGLELTAEQLFDLFHKHLDKYTNYTVRYFIFHWWIQLRHYVKGATPTLDCPWEYFKLATKEEIEQARKDFSQDTYIINGEKIVSTHTFSDDARVLEYRGERFIIDNEWGAAWTKNKKDESVSFQLQWDWWYPIDEFLDLYNI